MIDRQSLWALAQETMAAFGPFYQASMRQAIQDTGVPQLWGLLNLARGMEPRPISVDGLHALAAYTSRAQLAERLEELAQLEMLERVGPEAYRLTAMGREAVEDVFEAAHEDLAAAQPLPEREMEQLAALLWRIVEATLQAPEPARKLALRCSRWTDPGEQGALSVRVDQYLTDLVRYRDDAHLAAWKPYDVGGPAWEALTFVWREQARTAEELEERLPYRPFTVEDYARNLQELVQRGWLVEQDGGYALTEEGRRVREQAERDTDRHFFVGWSALSEEELGRLQDLLGRASDSLQEEKDDS